jgi:hypothetical protein
MMKAYDKKGLRLKMFFCRINLVLSIKTVKGKIIWISLSTH